MKVAVLGSTGYTGQVLLRILLNHPDVQQIYPVSSSCAGLCIFEHDAGLSQDSEKLGDGLYLSMDELSKRNTPDLVFAALPHLKSAEMLVDFLGKIVIVDLSADFRIPDSEHFTSAYGQPPPRPDLLSRAVYGLSEWKRAEICQADLIANPGCYPTATLLPLLPLLKADLVQGPIIVNALSGISGAGTEGSRTSALHQQD